MATAPPLTPTAAPPERIRHPLERLRGTIRRYVALEGTLAIGLFIVVWFWLHLALDLGSFKLFAFDWVQEWPRSARAGILFNVLVALAVVVGLTLVRRLLVDFSPQSLALVLERHFPDALGDRLITAVELADLDRAEARGYSRSMIVETVREAGDRVAALPVHEVFDWGRLRRRAGWVLAAVLVPWLLTGAVFSTVKRTDPRVEFLPRFRESAGTWFRRDVLLQNVIWPRKAYLEVLDFPPSGDLRVGRDAPSPRLRVRAHRWVIADPAAPEGWRALMWTDLTPELVGSEVPSLPTHLLEPAAAAARVAGLVAAAGPIPVARGDEAWTLDRVEVALEDSAVRDRLAAGHADVLAGLNRMLERLAVRVAEPGMRSTFRRLEVPDRVEVRYWGPQTSNRMELLRGPGWEYTGVLGDLKESVKFWVRGADYYTATRFVTLVPPPSLQQLKRVEYRPAYFYYRPPAGDALALRGLRQRIEELASLNGPTSRFAIPEGTDLVLEGQLDKELTAVILRPRTQPADGPKRFAQELPLADGGLAFRCRFDRLAGPLDFDLEFTDTDGVKSARHVVVDCVRDLPPAVNVLIDGVRKTAKGPYLVTPDAMIPFEGKVADGIGGGLGGLNRVEYSAAVNRLQAPIVVAGQAAWLVAAALAAGPLADSTFTAAVATAEVSSRLAAEAPESAPRTFPLMTFAPGRPGASVPTAELPARLEQAPGPPPLPREFTLQPKFEFFDLRDRMPELKAQDELAVQPRFRMKLTVVARDANVETGPGVGTNKEPPFNVLVVSEAELLVEVARDEETLHIKTEDAIARLRETRQKFGTVTGELNAAGPDGLSTLAQRTQEVHDGVGKSRDVVQEVFTEYSRLLRELELNRVSDRIVAKVKGEICLPLESALKGEFVAAEEALELFRKELEAVRKPDEPSTARVGERLDRLIAKLEQVLTAMGEVTTINKLIAALREIEKGQEQAIGARLKELQRLQRQKLIDDLNKIKGLEDK